MVWSKICEATCRRPLFISNAAIGNLLVRRIACLPFRTDNWEVEQVPVRK